METKFVKLTLKSQEIKYFIVNLEDGRITESGDEDETTFEDTFIDLKTIEVGKKPLISYNYSLYTRKFPDRAPVWSQLNYEITATEEFFKKKNEKPI